MRFPIRAADAALHAEELHPDYEYATTEGPRKRWSPQESQPIAEPGEPPWERNPHRGRIGWERIGDREEAYWMRPRISVDPGPPTDGEVPGASEGILGDVLVAQHADAAAERDRLRKDLEAEERAHAETQLALRGLVARVERDGGYATPEDQATLRAARAALGIRRVEPRAERMSDPALVARGRIAELEATIREYIAAHDAPARSGNRGETSVWLARTGDAERALRQAVGGPIRFPFRETPGVVARAEQLEAKVAELETNLGKARRAIDFFASAVGAEFDWESWLEGESGGAALLKLAAGHVWPAGAEAGRQLLDALQAAETDRREHLAADGRSRARIAALESELASLRTAVGLAETWTRHRDDAKRQMATILGLSPDVTIGQILVAARRLAERIAEIDRGAAQPGGAP